MDAKPQRPGRALRIWGDENAIPIGDAPKLLHQRNKSSPALSSMLHNGPTKGTTKRMAFGDVSNTANIARPSKDDSALNFKAGTKFPEKIVLANEDRKALNLQRPAHRPLSISGGLKGILNTVTNVNTNKEPIQKQPLAEIQQSIQAPTQSGQADRLGSKKSSLTLKDIGLSSNTQIPPPSKAPLPPIHRDLPSKAPLKATQEHVEPQLHRAKSRQFGAVKTLAAEPAQSNQPSSDAGHVLRSDGIYIDEKGAVQVYQFEDAPEVLEETVDLAGTRVSSNMQRPVLPVQDEAPKATGHMASNSKPEEHQKPALAPVSEPEEYWEEDAGDHYEEEGYVTARSFKSRTDNTTGNVTTVLFPKVTQKVKKEITAAKELVERSKTLEELEDEAWDTTMVAEYGDEIFQYMREMEIKMLPNPHYMDNQAEIQWSMRAVLMDWIVQVHHRFNLLPETLFLTANYIDRFLSCKVVSLGKLQLVGATAIFIAAKYEEIDCPSVQEIVYMVDNGYSVDEILKAERFMLSMLQFELGWPGPMSFLRRISKADDYDLETRTLAKYFLEITIMDERFVGSPPSFVAAGAHCLARMMLRKGNWSPTHVYYSNYTYSQLFSLVLLMVECCEDARQHHCAVFDKYTDKRYKKASHFAESEMRKGFQVLDVNSNNSPRFGNMYDPNIWNPSQRQPILGEAA